MKMNQNYTSDKEIPNFRERGGSLEIDDMFFNQMMDGLNNLSLHPSDLESRMRRIQEFIDQLNTTFFKDACNRTRPPPRYLDFYNRLCAELHKCQEEQIKQQLKLAKASDDAQETKASQQQLPRSKLNSTNTTGGSSSLNTTTDNGVKDEHSTNQVTKNDNRAPITLTDSDNEDDDLMKSLRDLNLIASPTTTPQSIITRPIHSPQTPNQIVDAQHGHHGNHNAFVHNSHHASSGLLGNDATATKTNLKRMNAYDNYVGASDSTIICRPDSLASKLLAHQADSNSLIGASTNIITSIGISKPSNPSSIATTPLKSPYREIAPEFYDKTPEHGAPSGHPHFYKNEPLNSPTKIYTVHPSHSTGLLQSQTSNNSSFASATNGGSSNSLQAHNRHEANNSSNRTMQNHNSKSSGDINDPFQHITGSFITTSSAGPGQFTVAPNPYLRVYIGTHTAVVKKENIPLRDAVYKKLRQNNLEIDKCIAYVKEDNKKVDWDTELSKIATDHVVVAELNEEVKHAFEKKTFSLRSCESCRKREILNLYQCSKCEYVMCQRPDCRKKSEKIVCCSKKTQVNPLPLPTHTRIEQEPPSGLDTIRENGHSQQILPVELLKVNMRRERSSSETELNSINAGLSDQPETPRPNQKSSMVSKAFTTTANDSTASMSTLLPDIRINDMNDHVGESGYSSLSQKFDKNKLNENLGKKTVPSRRDSFNSWEIPHKQIKIDLNKNVGSGSFGIVHQGKDFYHGNVAIKFLNVQNPTPAQAKAFRNEVIILKSTRHDNVLLFIGCILKPYLAIVTEWCPGSSLYRHLHVEEEKWEINELISISKQTSTGMEYLHARGILHRDLKSNNIFLIPKEKTNIQAGYRNQMNMANGSYELDLDEQQSEKWTVKIGDFGLATVKSNWNSNTTAKTDQPTGSILWMAPEVIRQNVADPYTIKSDVYSFGVVLYELFTGNLPYLQKEQNMILFLVGSGRLKPNCQDARIDTPQEIKNILTICCDYDRNKRPDFVEINKLFKLIKIFKVKSKLKRAKSEPVLSQFEYSSSMYETNDDYPGTPSYNTSNRVNSPTNSRFGEYLKRYQEGVVE